MPIPARLSIVTLGVADLARSVAFYEALGWERCASSNEDICWFRTSDSYIGLFPYQELSKDAGLQGADRGRFGGVTLAICVDSPEAVALALEEAVRAGARLLKPATRAEWGGISGYFADPDGYPWEIAHNPFFPINADGSTTIP